MHTLGGLAGEIILTFTALYEYIVSNPANANFNLSQEHFETLLVGLVEKEPYLFSLSFGELLTKGADG